MTLSTKLYQQDSLRKNVTQYENTLTASQYDLPHAITKKYVDSSNEVLDWGCGNGHFAYFLSQVIKCKVKTFSFSDKPKSISHLKDIEHTTSDKSSPVKIPYENNSFDRVFSIGVLEHVHETGGSEVGSLQEIHRLLKPNGMFLCFHFPRKYSLNEFMINLVKKFLPGKVYTHPRKFTKSDVSELCRKAGFEVVEIGSYNFLPRNRLNNLPSFLKDSVLFKDAFNLVDLLLSKVFALFNQNLYFVARSINRK